MFKLESYLTPILLSYVDKYIKNFRPEDAQVSLWGGDASFHNLDLRLEVLEQELHLPLSFISGHIHDLIIHVPWTKLASEPITITINTIECILKLKDETSSSDSSNTSGQKRDAKKKLLKANEEAIVQQPPGYMQNLVNKIVNNICINCNNLILKYVEEDIVVSVNIRMLKLSSANQQWLPTFTELPTGLTFLRKLMTITDLTICLDKRNSAGKIDVYQEPMLYRCSLELRILQCYHPLYTKKYSVLRVDLHCSSLEFSMTEQQIPMLIRLILLSQILMQRFSKKPDDDETSSQTEDIDSDSESAIGNESWAGWAWSFVPSIFPTGDNDWNNENLPQITGHTLQVGYYIDNLSFIFKISECTNEGSFYVPKKIKYWPLIRANIKGIYFNMIQHGPVWRNIQAGISEVIVIPQGNCCCGIPEVVEGSEPIQYLHIGTNSTKYMDDSLFDDSSVENNNTLRLYNFNWNQHLQTYSETILLENTPALCMDLIHQLELPEDVPLEKVYEYNGDLEYSNIPEKSISRYVLGTMNLKVCSGLLHRVTAVYKAAMAYDYSPYGGIPQENEPERNELKPPTADDFEALNEFIPVHVTQFTSFNMKMELFLMDHVYFEPVKGNLRSRRKGSTAYLQKPNNLNNLPGITIETQCIDAKLIRPLYPNRLVYTTCQLPKPPDEMFEACYRRTTVKVLGLASNLIIDDKSCTILLPSTLTATYNEITLPKYWPNQNMPHLEFNFKAEKFIFTLTKATLLVIIYIYESFLKLDDKLKSDILNSTLLNDVPQTVSGILELQLEDVKLQHVGTMTTTTSQVMITSFKGFIIEQSVKSVLTPKGQYFQSKLKKPLGTKTSKEVQQVMVISGPELSDDLDIAEVPFLSIIAQFSKSQAKQVHPPLFTFHIAELRLNFDPLLCRWFYYEPKINSTKENCSCVTGDRKTNYSESTSTAMETPRRTLTTHESVHSSDQHYPQIIPYCPPAKEEEKAPKLFLEQVVKFYNVLSNIILFGTISPCIIYFPTKTLITSEVASIQEALETTYASNKDLEVLVIQMPNITAHNNSHLQSLNKYVNRFPIQVPESMWQPRKTFFPWNITVDNLRCWTLQNGITLNLVKSITWNIAIDVSVKYNPIQDCEQCGNKVEKSMETGAVFCGNCGSPVNTLSNLDLRVYVDTPPVQFNISDQQVYLITHLSARIFEIFEKMFPNCIDKPPPPIPRNICVHHKLPGSTPSISLYRESTPCSESISETPPEISTLIDLDDDPIKLSALFQWTLSRLRVNIFSQDLNLIKDGATSFNDAPDIKMVVNVEDMFTSVNLLKIYMKTEVKIASANIYQYKLEDGKWELGPFLGLVMRSQDDESTVGPMPENQGSFLKITMTRARCDHAHNKWGARPKYDKKAQVKISYIKEIDVTMQPIDVLVSVATLRNFLQNFYSNVILDEDSGDSICKDPERVESTLDERLYRLNNHQLPLLYLDCRSLRIIMPASELIKKSHAQDVCIFQVHNINLRPNANNPICRTPLRPDMYQQAARGHVLNIPGADIEDRQYELNILDLTVATGNWTQLDPVLSRESSLTITSLRTMNENPALEWNNLENKPFNNIRPRFNLMYIISGLNLSIIFAPAIVSSNDVLICGHSLEINAISDLELKICTTQILLATELATECINMFEPIISPKCMRRRPKFRSSYTRRSSLVEHLFKSQEEFIDEENVKDSGVEDESQSYYFPALIDLEKCRKEDIPFFFQPESVENKQMLHVPVDILITGGNMTLILYQFESNGKFNSVAKNFEGYDGSDEKSSEELSEYRTQPLFYFLLGQPNIYISRLIFERKIHLSIFDIKAMVNPTSCLINGIPNKSHFETHLIETKPGQPNSSTGILPAFISIKWSRRTANITEASIEISRPTKIHFSLRTWQFLIFLSKLLIKTVNEGSHQEHLICETTSLPMSSPRTDRDSLNEFVQYKKLHEKLMFLTAFNFNCAQIVFCLTTKTGMDVIFGCEKIQSHLVVKNRPERITNSLLLECLTLSVIQGTSSRLLLNPWSVTTEVHLFWESWQDVESQPQISISADTDCLRFDIGSEQLDCLETVGNECQEFLNTLNDTTVATQPNYPLQSTRSQNVTDQHYKDDLRAGAFQFVDANLMGYDDLPLPYQVIFSKHPQTTMSWRYPQPRALTKVRVFPVPFRDTTKSDSQVLCRIEFWSEAQNLFKPFAQFQLSESELYQLDLPKKIPQPAVSCIWRVVLGTDDDSSLLSPRALAACIRIDSYFNPILVPDLQVSINISTLQLHLYNYLDKGILFKMPDCMKEYTPDQVIPENQCFLVFNFEKAHFYSALWKSQNEIYFGIDGIIQCFILDYAFLSRQHFIEQSAVQLSLGLSNHVDLEIQSKPIKINFSPSIGHTLATSMELWGQTWTNRRQLDLDNVELVVLTRYVICNDTTLPLRFGQAGTDEDIFVDSRHCHLYSWRSQKCKQLLRVALNENNSWIWSVPFYIGTDGTKVCMVGGSSTILYLTIKSLSTTQKQVIISSDLIIVNNLNEQLEIRVIPDPEQIAHLIPRKTRYPSLRLGLEKSVKLRIRYHGLDSAWSGDIPVQENLSCDQPWLVKVPLHERGHFLSIWCQVIIQNFNENKRFLVTFWPLFTIRSNLSVDAKVNIETPTLHVALETTITGQGKLQQLYCPGTTDHSHQLTFKLESSPPSDTYVPLNYSLVNQKTFFKKSDKQDIDEVLSKIVNYDVTKWPFCEEPCFQDWRADDQPLTHVQVRYDKVCPYGSSLMLELLPWCLLMNITGYPVMINVNQVDVCRVAHYGIVTPPKFEQPFCLGIFINQVWYLSSPMKLETIPITGSFSININCDLMICRLLISSYERNEMRIMTVGCSHSITNTTDFDLLVCSLALPQNSENKDVPSNLPMHSFRVPAKISKKLNAIPLTQWIQYGSCENLDSEEISFYLFISVDNIDFSQPIRVDRLARQTFSVVVDHTSLSFVLTVTEHQNRLNITIHRDTYPQLIIENNTLAEIVVGEHVREKDKDNSINEIGIFNWRCIVKPEAIRHYTMPTVTTFFPDISKSLVVPKLTVAAHFKDKQNRYQWCQGIDVTTANEMYIRTNTMGDIKVTIVLKCHTTQIIIDSVTQAEFSAGDVRNRLQMIVKESKLEDFPTRKLDLDNFERSEIVRRLPPEHRTPLDCAIQQKLSPVSEFSETKPMSVDLSEDLNVISETSLQQSDSVILKLKSMLGMKLNMNITIQGIVLTLTKDLQSDSYKTADIAAFYLDHLFLNILETESEKTVALNISDVQFDNQLFSQGTFDFPVVFRFEHESSADEAQTDHPKTCIEMKIVIKKWSSLNHIHETEHFSGIHTIYLKLKPFKAFVEGEYINELMEYVKSMMPVNLVILPQIIREDRNLLESHYIFISEGLLSESEILAKPVKINSLVIEPVFGTLSLRSNLKIYIALDDSPISFPVFQRKNIITTPYRLGHALTVHFLSGAIVGAGWMVGALELLGNPGGLARSVGVGLKDFISKPYEGIMNGPWGLVVGVSQGSASLIRNITAGTLNSVSKFAGSLARNLDIMSLDMDHLQRAEEARRQRPSGMVSQIAHGFTNFGISILGAVGGLAQQPLQSMVSDGASPTALAAGFGKGLMGIITKPIGGAAELVSVTGNAILQETGWKSLPNPRCTPVFHHIFNTDNASVKYSWKFLPELVNADRNILCDTEATMIGIKGEYHAVALILTSNELILVNTDEDITQRVIFLKDLEPILTNNDPTLLSFNFVETIPNENVLEMDPAARARVVDYVRSTVSGLSDISSLSSNELHISVTQTEAEVMSPALMFYVNPQWRNYFLNILSLAKRHSQKRGFSVL